MPSAKGKMVGKGRMFLIEEAAAPKRFFEESKTAVGFERPGRPGRVGVARVVGRMPKGSIGLRRLGSWVAAVAGAVKRMVGMLWEGFIGSNLFDMEDFALAETVVLETAGEN